MYARRQKPAKGFRYLPLLNGCHNREKRRRNTYDFQDSQWRTARRLHVVRRGSDRGCCRRCSEDESRLQESERHEVGQDDEVLREKVSSTHFNCTEAAGPQTRCFFFAGKPSSATPAKTPRLICR